MHRAPLIMVCTCEIAGQVRGKAFPASELPARMTSGVGWVPSMTMISALGPTADTPFGLTGELILVPDPATEVQVEFGDDGEPEHFFLGDLRETDGTPWCCCPRDFARRAIAALQREARLQVLAAFEHEFTYTGIEARGGAAFSLDAFRRQGAFGAMLVAAMTQAGLQPDSFLPEYGPRQFEVTVAPARGLRAADQAVITREMVRATAHRLNSRALLTPAPEPNDTGNGVHVHLSLLGPDGAPALPDPAGRFGLSPAGRSFAAGILDHQAALVALTAPSPVSALRLRPDRIAPTHVYLADRDRGASLRLCPGLQLPGMDPRRQLNLEYRAADATASPYFALGAIVWAGLDGIRRGLDLPPHADVADMDDAARSLAGIPRLPATLDEALDRLEATEAARDWFGPVLFDAYLRHKRAELRMVAELNETALCELYAQLY